MFKLQMYDQSMLETHTYHSTMGALRLTMAITAHNDAVATGYAYV